MGALKLRNIEEITTKASIRNLVSSGGTSITKAMFRTKATFKNITLEMRNMSDFGCCTSLTIYQTPSEEEIVVMGIKKSHLPNNYKSIEFIEKWVSFINKTLPLNKVRFINNPDNAENVKFFSDLGVVTNKLDNGHYYFYIEKFEKDRERKYKVLFQVSLIRYLVSSEYYFMVNDSLMLRDKKSLKHLSNLQILELAKHGVQLNKEQFASLSYSSVISYIFLRGYRSPLYSSYYAKRLNTPEKIMSDLNQGSPQNTACYNSDYLDVSVLYLMHLYQRGHYVKLADLLFSNKLKIAKNASNIITRHYSSLGIDMNDINVQQFIKTDFNIKNYEKNILKLNKTK